MKTHYQVLGVAESASDDVIKHAYRRLVKRYHPDHSGTDATADLFSEVRQAYEVLGRTASRQHYDSDLKKARNEFKQADRKPFSEARAAQAKSATKPGSNTENAWNRSEKNTDFSQLFKTVFKKRFQNTDKQSGQASLDGQDIHVRIKLSLENAHRGGRQKIRLPGNIHHPERETVDIDVPSGVKNDQVLRFPALGHPGVAGGQTGDLYVKVQIQPHPFYQLEATNLLLVLPVYPWELMAGGEFEIPGLAENLNLTVPPGTSNRTRFRISEKGYAGFPRGDLIVIVEVQIPLPKTTAQKNLTSEISQVFSEDIRAVLKKAR